MSELEFQYKTLKLLEGKPQITQRELARELGVSLGKTHYVLKALVNVGWVKLDNFRRSDNKLGYSYILTPEGIKEKSKITLKFLERKQEEYLRIRQDIEALQREVHKQGGITSNSSKVSNPKS